MDTSLPGDGVTEGPRKGTEGPVLDGVPLSSTTHSPPREDEMRNDAPPEMAMLNRNPEEIKLGGITLLY